MVYSIELEEYTYHVESCKVSRNHLVVTGQWLYDWLKMKTWHYVAVTRHDLNTKKKQSKHEKWLIGNETRDEDKSSVAQ